MAIQVGHIVFCSGVITEVPTGFDHAVLVVRHRTKPRVQNCNLYDTVFFMEFEISLIHLFDVVEGPRFCKL